MSELLKEETLRREAISSLSGIVVMKRSKAKSIHRKACDPTLEREDMEKNMKELKSDTLNA